MQDPCPEKRQKTHLKIPVLSGVRHPMTLGRMFVGGGEGMSLPRCALPGSPRWNGEDSKEDTPAPLYYLGEGRLKLKKKNQKPCVGCVAFGLFVFNSFKFFTSSNERWTSASQLCDLGRVILFPALSVK